MRYDSKQDPWLSLLPWAVVIFPSTLIILLFIKDDISPLEGVIAIVILTVIDIFIIWFWFSTYYVITEDQLLIRYGPF